MSLTSSQPSLSIHAEDGSRQLDLGIIISTSAVATVARVVVQNNTPSAHRVSIRLSPVLASRLAVCIPYNASHTNTPEPHPHDINLLHNSLSSTIDLLLAPHAPHHTALRFLAHPCFDSQAAHADNLIPVQGPLHLTSDHHPTASLQVSFAVCPSLLTTLPTTHLHFTHTSPRTPVTLPLTVRNLSPVPTAFQLSSSHCPNPLRISTPDSLPLPPTVPIQPSSSRVLHLTLTHPCPHYPFTLAIHNLHNSANVIHLPLSETLPDPHPPQCLISLDCPSHFDFGDCYSGCRTFRDIVITSKAPHTILVSLSSDRRSQVSFELLSYWPDIDSHPPTSSTRPVLDLGALTSLHEVFDAPTSPLSRRQSGLRPPEEYVVEGGGRHQSTSGAFFTPLPAGSSDAVEVTRISAASKTRLVDEVTLDAGQQRRLRVWYLPRVTDKHGTSSDLDRGRLVDDAFLLMFKLPDGEKVNVFGRSRVCESNLGLERDEVDLGNCDVLTLYHAVISIINYSDMPAEATIEYVSQCVTAEEHEVRIPPRKTVDIKLCFVPRQVNPSYQKEITLTNRRNPQSPAQTFRLRANCVDRQGISLHALFYKILAPNATNEVDFGVTVANHPAIRAFRFQNVTKGKLRLRISTGTGVRTYIPTKEVSAVPGTWKGSQKGERSEERRYGFHVTTAFRGTDAELNLDTVGLFRGVNALVDKNMSFRDLPVIQGSNSEHVGAFGNASYWEKKTDESVGQGEEYEYSVCDDYEGMQNDFDDNGDVFPLGGEHSWLEFLKCLDERDFAHLNSIPMFFSNHQSELRYAERQFRPGRRLMAALRDGFLEETNVVKLGPGGECLMVVSLMLTDEEVRRRTKTRTYEKKLIVDILEFDDERLRDAAATSSKELNDIAKQFKLEHKSMPRALLLTVQACKSQMRVSPLRQLNFGRIAAGEQKDKAFTVVNLSDVPLLYEVRKESQEGHELRFNLGKRTKGVVGPYSSKVVPFIYAPVKAGLFEETIVVENRMDKSASRGLVVKACVGD